MKGRDNLQKQALITVVVPIYNMGCYLDRAMKSLLEQTYNNYEVLLIDDGSTDGGSQKCDIYAEKYEKIHAYHKKNGGLSSARNYGIKYAKGDYIIFPDPDDWVSEKYLEDLSSLINESSDLEVCGHYVVTKKDKKIHATPERKYELNQEEAMLSAMTASGFCGFAWNKLYHMNIIKDKKMKFDEELGMAQDLHFLIQYLKYCEKIIYWTKPLYFYFQHAGGVTNASLSDRKISGLKTYEKIAELVRDEHPTIMQLAKSTYVNMSLQFMFIYYATEMEYDELLVKLKKNLKRNFKYFLKNVNYGMGRKMLGIVALISPKISYKIRKCVSK